MLVRCTIQAGGQRDWPGRHSASMRQNWTATLTTATTAAACWACQEWDGIAASSPDDSSGGPGCAGSDSKLQNVQQRDRLQRYLRLQQAAIDLGKAVQLLLPPDAIGSLDALEQEWAPALLAALAAVCSITSDALDRYLQVPLGHVVD